MNKNTFITSITKERENKFDRLSEEEMNELKAMAGEYGAICYSSEKFSEVNETDEQKIKRFNRVAVKLRHPITEHTSLTVVFEGLSKMQAMLLNSYGRYSTLERSARYTNLEEDLTGLDKKLYMKWKDKCTDILRGKAPDQILDKIAKENARYMVSIFAHYTTMAYTTNLRMWSIILKDLVEYRKAVEHEYNAAEPLEEVGTEAMYGSYFRNLLSAIDNLIGRISSTGIGELTKDLPGSPVHLLECNISPRQIPAVLDAESNIGWNYMLRYQLSYAAFAQEQRQRTLTHYIGVPTTDIYIPFFLKEKDKQEWIEDMTLNKNNIPQGIMVNVIEIGDLQGFGYKCIERLCQDAQYEIRKKTEENFNFMVHHSEIARWYLHTYVKPKCGTCPKFGAGLCDRNWEKLTEIQKNTMDALENGTHRLKNN